MKRCIMPLASRAAFATVELSPVSPGILAARLAPSNCQHTPHSSALDLADRGTEDLTLMGERIQPATTTTETTTANPQLCFAL